jgi:trans-aconitate methyltransferase
MSKLFDLSDEYDSMLNQGLRLSGESRAFFLEGRVKELGRLLPKSFAPRKILDFGCGIGDSTAHLAATFPGASLVVGADTAERALEHAQKTHGSTRIRFVPMSALERDESGFDLCYVNGVFHHIPPSERAGAMGMLFRSMTPGAVLALFENNPWNPGTRLVMSRVPFDRDAVTLTIPETRRMVRDAGFTEQIAVRTLFYFPRALSMLRPLEPVLGGLPLGAQYGVIARRG